MLAHILNGKNNIEVSPRESKVHSVPCKIHADCDAKVTTYFEPYIQTLDDKALTASFRGYPLNGQKVQLPEGYTGIVLHESIQPKTKEQERKFYVVNNFKSIVYWNWDKYPSKNDAFMKALDWIDVAEALHTPITE